MSNGRLIQIGTKSHFKELDAIRQEVGRHIDPETAEVWWKFGYNSDPYGDDPDLPEECRQIGRVYFARSPGSDTWIWFGHLPEKTVIALWKRKDVSSDDDDLHW